LPQFVAENVGNVKKRFMAISAVVMTIERNMS